MKPEEGDQVWGFMEVRHLEIKTDAKRVTDAIYRSFFPQLFVFGDYIEKGRRLLLCNPLF